MLCKLFLEGEMNTLCLPVPPQPSPRCWHAHPCALASQNPDLSVTTSTLVLGRTARLWAERLTSYTRQPWVCGDDR